MLDGLFVYNSRLLSEYGKLYQKAGSTVFTASGQFITLVTPTTGNVILPLVITLAASTSYALELRRNSTLIGSFYVAADSTVVLDARPVGFAVFNVNDTLTLYSVTASTATVTYSVLYYEYPVS